MEKVVTIVPLKNQPSDYQYWLTRSVADRLDAIELLRRQYLEMAQNVEPRLQRVCHVITWPGPAEAVVDREEKPREKTHRWIESFSRKK